MTYGDGNGRPNAGGRTEPNGVDSSRDRLLSAVFRGSQAAMPTGDVAADDAVAVVAPDGTVVFANRRYAAIFDEEIEAVAGTHWHDRHPEATIDRLERRAIPTAVDGWRWTGRCRGRRADGTTFVARTTLLGLDDGRVVFVVEPPDDADPDESTA